MSFNPWGGNSEPVDEKKQLEKRIAGDDLSDRADALEEMADYLAENEPEVERASYLMAAIEVNRELGRERAMAELYIELGDYENGRKHQGEALEAYLKSVEVGKGAFLESPTVRAMLDVAGVYRDRDDFANALIWFNSAYELAIASELPSLAAKAKSSQSRIEQQQGEYAAGYASIVVAHNLLSETSEGALPLLDTLTNQAWIGIFAPELGIDVDAVIEEADALADQVFQPMSNEFIRILSLLNRVSKGNPADDVEEGFEAILQDTRRRNDAIASSVVNFGLAWCAAEAGKNSIALARLRKFLLADDYLDSRIDRRIVLRLQARLQESLGLGVEAIATVEQLQSYLAEHGPAIQAQAAAREFERLTEAFPPAKPWACFLSGPPELKPEEEADVLTSIVGDITKLNVDAIVNAARTSLAGGGGVDGAIHAAAGSALVEACLPLAPCPVGEARVTPGFRLPAKYVVHTVGPVYKDGLQGEPQLLAAAYYNSLAAAAGVGARTIAFPGISTGIYGYPVELATQIAVAAIREYLSDHADHFDAVQLIWLTTEQADAAAQIIAGQ